jgi:hypothetical protein
VHILACYVTIDPRVKAALTVYAPDAELVYTGATDTAYWQAITARWTGVESLVIIEQDNEITYDVLGSFAACAEPWCCFAYRAPAYDIAPNGTWREVLRRYPGTEPPVDHALITTSLGCTKFSAGLQRSVGHREISAELLAWDVIDTTIALCLIEAGYRPHVHGEIPHHHDRETIWLQPPADDSGRYTWRHASRGGWLRPAPECPAHLQNW